MNQTINETTYPKSYQVIEAETNSSGFTMASDVLTCSLLRTLAAAKPSGDFLELGTGTGLSAAWLLDGMDEDSQLTSIDNAGEFMSIARKYLGSDQRLRLIETDAEQWIQANTDATFDYIFADTWHGKFFSLDETLAMLKPGGFYIIDDMLPQPNWPEGHAEKVDRLIIDLEARQDLVITKQHWATGIIVGVKK